MDETATEIRYLRITNRNDWTLVDRYDNRIYEFPPDQQKTIPLEAGMHIFGYGPTATEEAVKLHCLKRFGFNRPEILASKQHDLFWDNLEIIPVSMRLVEVEEDEDEDPEPEVVPERAPPKPRKNKGGRPKKRVLVPKNPAYAAGLGHSIDIAQAQHTGEVISGAAE